MDSKLLLVGWSAADWQSIHPLMDAGEMPALQALVNGGVSGTLLAQPPFFSPTLWTSASTGLTPDRHGILLPREPDPLDGVTRPPSSASLRAPSVWDLLSQAGFRSHVIGWPVTHPAPKLSGVAVSDRFPHSAAPPGTPWPVLPGAVSPADAESALLDLRVHPGDLNGKDLLPLVPAIREIDQQNDLRLVPLGVALAETATLHAAATWCLENREWDFAAVHYSLAGRLSPAYMRYAPPRLDEVSERDFHLYREVMRNAYKLQDAMLGRLIELAGPGARVIVFSGHGFLSGQDRPPKLTAQPDPWIRTHGMFCMGGPGIRRDELVHGARLLDVAPTVLASFGLPASEDMPGRVLADAFDTAPDLSRVPAYDSTADACETPGVPEALESLWEAGYKDPIGPALEAALHRAGAARDLHLAWAHLGAGRFEAAIPPLEAVLRADPSHEIAQLELCLAFLLSGRLGDCAAQLDRISPAASNRVFAHLIKGRLLLAQGQAPKALVVLNQARELAASPALQHLLGEVYRVSGRILEAENCYRSALEMDRYFAPAFVGLAAALLGQHRDEEAMHAALDATGLNYGIGSAHYLLGVAFLRLRMFDHAATALETCLKIDPEMPHARRLLRRLKPEPKAAG